jgi:hypothetical protein
MNDYDNEHLPSKNHEITELNKFLSLCGVDRKILHNSYSEKITSLNSKSAKQQLFEEKAI